MRPVRSLVGALGVFLLVPASVSAVDINQLLSQIETLRAQILLLQQGNTQVEAPVTTCDLPTKTMRRGDAGVHVSHLQEFLARDISVYPEGTVSGYFGALTEAAVQKWQIKKSIVFSGTAQTTGFGAVGPRTLAAMRAEWCLHSLLAPSPFVPPPGSTVPSNTNTPSTTPKASTTTSSQVVVQAVPRIMFTAPGASTTVTKGNSLVATWRSDAAPVGASVTLSLQSKTGQTLGVVKNNLSSSGSYYWTVPLSAPVTTSTCTADPITCLAQIAQSSSPCTTLCSVADGLYKFYAQLVAGGKELAHAESRIFSIGGVPLSTSDITNTGTFWDYALYSTTSTWTLPSATSTSPLMCVYSGVQYTDGISVEINCADVTVAGQSCGSYGGMQLTCRSGKWVDRNGMAQDVRGVTTGYTAGSCITPWMAQTVANGNLIPREPFFTNGVYASQGTTLIMKCNNGQWQTCDTVGFACH